MDWKKEINQGAEFVIFQPISIIYSSVHKNNAASLNLHKKLGFLNISGGFIYE
jgi:hypothetical protein